MSSSAATLGKEGLGAVKANKWEEAITKLSQALQESTHPDWFIGRSKAFIGTVRFQESLGDAEHAYHAAWKRGTRETIIEAQYRRAVAYNRLGQYANADYCALIAMQMADGEIGLDKDRLRADNTDENGFWKPTAREAAKIAEDRSRLQSGQQIIQGPTIDTPPAVWRSASILRINILKSMDKLPADDPARKATATFVPEVRELASQPKKNPAGGAPVQKPVVPTDTPLRMQDFQTSTAMTVSIFSKGADKEKLKVEFLPESVRLDSIAYPSGEWGEFLLEPYAEIDPSASTYTVTPNKVELRLAKKMPLKWPQITKDKTGGQADNEEVLQALKEARKRAMDEADAKALDKPEKPAKPEAEKTTNTSGPAYPTSSRTGPKNWDKIGAEDDEEEEAGVNDFFKKLYHGATPDQQRAMMKSFTESNGTSLSTDWNDVGSRTVDTVPPEGVEAKKW